MTWTAFFLIAASATFHAAWNLLAKKYRMTMPFYALMCATAALAFLNVQFWTPVPVWHMPARFYLSLAGMLVSEGCYCTGMMISYRRMDMSSAYPVMRALPLLLTVAVTAVFGIGKPLTLLTVCGMVLVFCGCMSMPLASFRQFDWRIYCRNDMLFLLLAACGTTGYTIFDSISLGIVREAVAGQGISPGVIAVSYYSTRGIFLSSSLMLCAAAIPGQRRHFGEIWRECRWMPPIAGICGSFTYLLVLSAMIFVSNVSFVQVFRQFGLLIGMLAGIVILKEKGSMPKYVGTALIIIGLILSVLKVG